jgi:uracil-DNA glycosylase
MSICMSKIHPSWKLIVENALMSMDQQYLKIICQQPDILPIKDNILNAFSVPLDQVKFIMIGESPYPRINSANGYAFWDASVNTLWSKSGLSKEVNRATSLRNFIKMLLITSGRLKINSQSQIEISKIEKSNLINTLHDLFNNLLEKGFLLLNASLVLSNNAKQIDAKYWKPFIEYIISEVYQVNHSVKLLLFGKIANKVLSMDLPNIDRLCSEHPYNLTFISNIEILEFFKPLNLLEKTNAK